MATALPLYDALHPPPRSGGCGVGGPTPNDPQGGTAPPTLEGLFRAIPTERARLAGIARKEGLGPEDALDCVQDAFCTFMKLAQRGEAANGPDIGATLGQMVKNAARNKRRLHHVAKPHDAVEEVDPADDALPTETLLAHAEDHLRLRACVAKLCNSQRAVVTLRMLEERDGEDVAALLGITRGHVDVLLHRAKGHLRSCMIEPRSAGDV